MSNRLHRLWNLLRGHRRLYAGAVFAILLSAGFGFLGPTICKYAIDGAIRDEPMQAPAYVHRIIESLGGRSTLAKNLWIASAGWVATAALSGVFSYLKGAWAARAAEGIAKDLRDRLYGHLQHLPCRYFDDHESGDLVQRCTSDIETIRMFLAAQVVEIGRSAVLLVTGMSLLMWLNWKLALVSAALMPAVVAFAFIFFRRIKDFFQRMDEAEGRMTGRLQENVTGIRVVRAFARQDYEIEQFAKVNAEYRDRWFRVLRLFAMYWPINNIMCLTQTGTALVLGGWFVAQGQMQVGTLYAFVAYMGMFVWPVSHIGRVLADTGKATVSIGRVGEILDAPVETDAPGAEATSAALARRDTEGAGHLVIANLSFSHGEDETLVDLNLEIRPGQTFAILGPSGSGKSTLMHLLLRLYDYETGTIHLDGVELRDLPRKTVRGRIASVLQEPFLYSRSLRDNVALAHGTAGEEEIIAATSAACIHESIAGFEHGYDTMVGERGVTLSGGQRQRVALARALLIDPAVLLLDDALSAVDTRTEAAIIESLRHRRGRRTTILIAHRLSTLQWADRIIVMDAGRIVQSGTHEQLLAQDGTYSRLWRIQNALADDLEQDLQAARALAATEQGGGA